jgi:hypothetical protein
MNRYITAALAAIAIGLTACGGGDDSPISAAKYEQTAPAGALTVGAGQTEQSVSIIKLEHHVGNKISRISIGASITKARSTGATSAGTRWIIRNGDDVIAQGPLSTAPAGGANGSTTHEVTVSGGSLISVEITGQVTGAGAALQWDGATLTLSSTPL